MNISGYGVSYNYNIYGTSANKAKTSSVITANPAEKPKTESKNSNATDSYYNLFNDKAKTSSVSLTKTELTRDEELLIAMAELGRKHAQQGIPWQEVDEEYIALAKEYIQPSRESLFGTPFCIATSTYEELEREREITAAYNAGYDFTTGRYSPPQDTVLKNEARWIEEGLVEARLMDGRLPSRSFANSREIYNSIYDRLTSRVA